MQIQMLSFLTELAGQCRNILPLAFSALTSLRLVNLEKNGKDRERILSSAEACGVRNQVSGHLAWQIEQQRCEPLLGRTRFSVLLTITRDPCKLEGRKFDRGWDIFG